MTPEEKQTALEAIASEVRTCTRCRLSQTRTRAVPGEGHPETEVVFVGEGPGYNEDQQGRPFVGAAGTVLTELVESIGWRRDEVFVTNVVKCRPPGNRDPEPDEIGACAPFLRRQLEVLDPALVVTLGRFSMQSFMPGARIGAVHGTHQPVDPATGAPHAVAYAMYHPAAALRQAALRETLRSDMAGIPDVLLQAREERATGAGTEADAGPAPGPDEPLGGVPEPVGGVPEPIGGDPEPVGGVPEPIGGDPEPLSGIPEPLDAAYAPALPSTPAHEPSRAADPSSRLPVLPEPDASQLRLF